MNSGEFRTSQGEFIALSPKCYYAKGSNGDVKLGQKGLPQHTDVTLNNFKSCLNGTEKFVVNYQTLTMKQNVMSRVSVEKKGLNRVFTKFRVLDDGISCAPLTLNDTYL